MLPLDPSLNPLNGFKRTLKSIDCRDCWSSSGFLDDAQTKAVCRLFISVLAICYGGGGIHHCPTSFDLPKAKAIAVSFETPNYNELPIIISIAHSFIYK